MTISKHRTTLEIIKNISVSLSMVLLGIIAVYGARLGYRELLDSKRERALIVEGIAKVNHKIVLQKIVSEKLKEYPIETVISVSDKLYDMCQLRCIPLDMVCGMIEVESMWKVDTISNVGAKGLLQLMPATARPYLALNQLSDKALFDPAINVMVGISVIYDLHQQYIMLGVEKENEYTFTITSYFWGSNNVATLLGRKDSRVSGPNFAYFKRVNEAAAYYRSKGL